MAVKRGGLGKGLDTLIPQGKNIQASEKTTQKSKTEKDKPVVVEKIVEKVVEAHHTV